MARVLGIKQLLQKKYNFLEGLPPEFIHAFGKLTDNFIAMIWGNSGNGKSSLLMQIIKVLMNYGKVLYVGLEEGFEASMQNNVLRHLDESHTGKIEFANHEMNYEALVAKLKKKKSPKFIVIDSIQYWNISYEQYKQLKQLFPRKSFLFISHQSGKLPDGKTAEKIMYDAGLKIRVEGYVATVISRYEGNNPFVIWEEGAKKYWGKEFRKFNIYKPNPNETTPLHDNKLLAESGQLVLGE